MQAQICNITGKVGPTSPWHEFTQNGVSGAFQGQSTGTPGWCFDQTNQRRDLSLMFDASLCSSVYTNNTNTVNPESMTTKFYICYK